MRDWVYICSNWKFISRYSSSSIFHWGKTFILTQHWFYQPDVNRGLDGVFEVRFTGAEESKCSVCFCIKNHLTGPILFQSSGSRIKSGPKTRPIYAIVVSVAERLRCRVGTRKVSSSNPVIGTAYTRSQPTQLSIPSGSVNEYKGYSF